AAATYEAAFAMTVPPPVIAANRALLSALVATNWLGQNTPAIAAQEGVYEAMWAADGAGGAGGDGGWLFGNGRKENPCPRHASGFSRLDLGYLTGAGVGWG